MSHWCRDIPRDEAVRASEDGRTGPLPTLEECIANITHKGESMGTKSDEQAADYRREASGLRTERVTLEITRPAIPNHPAPAKFWMWEYVLRDIVKGDRESVRVVEEAAPSASGGGELEPVAWGRRSKATGKLTYLTTEPPRCIWSHEDIVPLYAAPQPASVWLTEEERKAVEFLASLDGPPCVDAARKAARIGKELLARSSPPEVVLPPMVIAYDDMDMLKEALAAAGIKMKEVGRE